MRTDAIVVLPPRLCHGSCLVVRQEPMLIQALITNLPLNDSITALSVAFLAFARLRTSGSK